MSSPHPVVRCERCGARNVQRYSTVSRKDTVVRYFRCKSCGGNFSTVDKFVAEKIRFDSRSKNISF